MKAIKNIGSLIFITILAGCAMPQGGPSLTAMQKASPLAFKIEKITPTTALEESRKIKANNEHLINAELSKLKVWSSKPEKDGILRVGDTLTIVLWTNQISLFDGNSLTTPLHKTKLGVFEVDNNGEIDLPYLGKVQVSDLSLNALSRKLTKLYKKTGEFIDPTVKINWQNRSKGVLVSGNVLHPGFIPAKAGGLSLSHILVTAGLTSSSSANLATKSTNSSYHANLIKIDYQHQQIELPFSVIYANNYKIPEGAHILVTHSKPYKVTLFGGGIANQGTFYFSSNPSVNDVLSEGGGLNPETANDKAIFVLQPSNHLGRKSIIYVIKWNNPAGLIASQRMLLKNGDIVYISTSPVVSVEKMAQIFSSFLLPATIIGSAVK